MPETESNDSTVGDLLATFVQAADPMLAADLRAAAAMTPQHPAAPEPETDANGKVSDDDRDCLRVAFGIEFREPVDHVRFAAGIAAVERIVAERVRVVEGERDAAVGALDVAPEILRLAEMSNQVGYWKTRAESAEAAHEAEKAAHERLRAGVEALADEPVAPYPAECHCSHGMGFQFHAYPCRYSREVPRSAVRSLLGGGEAR